MPHVIDGADVFGVRVVAFECHCGAKGADDETDHAEGLQLFVVHALLSQVAAGGATTMKGAIWRTRDA